MVTDIAGVQFPEDEGDGEAPEEERAQEEERIQEEEALPAPPKKKGRKSTIGDDLLQILQGIRDKEDAEIIESVLPQALKSPGSIPGTADLAATVEAHRKELETKDKRQLTEMAAQALAVKFGGKVYAKQIERHKALMDRHEELLKKKDEILEFQAQVWKAFTGLVSQ